MKKNLLMVSAAALLLATSCSLLPGNSAANVELSAEKKGSKITTDYRKEMRRFVINLSEYARKSDPDFIVIPQNGQAVAWKSKYDENPSNKKNVLYKEYYKAINGTGREDTFYGAGDEDYTPTTEEDSELFVKWCDVYKNQTGADGKKITVLSTDYCKKENFADSYKKNSDKGYIVYPASDRELNNINSLPVYNENSSNINYLSDAKNFLYILNYEKFHSTKDLLKAIQNTNYDLIIMDAYNIDGELFTSDEISSLKTKKNGGKRLVVSYMSIGEAEDYRYYFNSSWVKDGKPRSSAPSWLDKENPEWEGNYKVRYWNSDWQKIIYGNKNSYTAKILNAGFDGVYLDIIDAYEYYE